MVEPPFVAARTALRDRRRRPPDAGFLPGGNGRPGFTKDVVAENQEPGALVRADDIKME